MGNGVCLAFNIVVLTFVMYRKLIEPLAGLVSYPPPARVCYGISVSRITDIPCQSPNGLFLCLLISG